MGTAPLHNPWFWLEFAGYTTPFVWVSVAAFSYYEEARGSQQLGAQEPWVCHRYLLWGLFGVTHLLATIATVPQYLEYETENRFSQWSDAMLGLLEIAAAISIWLAYFPPVFYRRRVVRRTQQSAAADAS